MTLYKLNTDVIEIPDILIESEDLFDLKDLVAHKILVPIPEKKCCDKCRCEVMGDCNGKCHDPNCTCHKETLNPYDVKEEPVMTPKTNEQAVEEWEKEFDRQFIHENVWEGEDEYTKNVAEGNIKDFIRDLLTRATAEAEKAFGGCKNCYGKGYSTVRETAGSYRTGVWELDPYIPCPKCDRGKQIQEMKEYLTGERSLK